MFGRPHSSLRPRTASLGMTESAIVRSQDEQQSDRGARDSDESAFRLQIRPGHAFGESNASETGPESGRIGNPRSPESTTQGSQPRAVLLQPQFHGHSVTNTKADSPNVPEGTPEAGRPSVLRSPFNKENLGRTTSQIRELMNRVSSNDMSEGRVLDDQKPMWQILRQQQEAAAADHDSTSAISSSRTVAADSSDTAAPISEESEPRTQGSVQPEGSSPDSIDSSAQKVIVTEDAVPAEPTMLDRLRGLYPGQSDESSRSRWRLPSPWSVFRDRGGVDVQDTADDADSDVQTAELNTNESASTVTTTDPLLRQLIESTEQQIANWPRSPVGEPQEPQKLVRRHQDLRLLYLIADRPGDAISAIHALPAPEQDFWQEVMLGLAQFRATSGDNPRERRLTNTVGQFRSAVRRLVPVTSLRIRRIDICSEIRSFGRVVTFPANSFDPGQPILLYVELENFSARTTNDGSYETNFDAQLQFFAEDGTEPIETEELSDISDLATSERVDYFQTFELNIPSHLESGRYRIQLKLVDRNSNRSAEGAVEFQVR